MLKVFSNLEIRIFYTINFESNVLYIGLKFTVGLTEFIYWNYERIKMFLGLSCVGIIDETKKEERKEKRHLFEPWIGK